MTSLPSTRDELAEAVRLELRKGSYQVPGETRPYEIQAASIADAILAAGYVKADHVEYAADHRFSDIEFTDEDGELWTDREDFEDYFKEYGGCKLVQRHVTEWEPLA